MESMFLSVEPSSEVEVAAHERDLPEVDPSYAMICYSGGMAESKAVGQAVEDNLPMVQDIFCMDPIPAAKALTELLQAVTQIPQIVVAPISDFGELTIHLEAP